MHDFKREQGEVVEWIRTGTGERDDECKGEHWRDMNEWTTSNANTEEDRDKDKGMCG